VTVLDPDLLFPVELVAMVVMIMIAVVHLVGTALVAMEDTVTGAHLVVVTMMMIAVAIVLLHEHEVQSMTTHLYEAVSKILTVASMLQTHTLGADLPTNALHQETTLPEMHHMSTMRLPAAVTGKHIFHL
jgi:hypothetical protein